MFYQTLLSTLLFSPFVVLYAVLGWIVFHVLKGNTHPNNVGIWMYVAAIFWPVAVLAMAGTIICAAIEAAREGKI